MKKTLKIILATLMIVGPILTAMYWFYQRDPEMAVKIFIGEFFMWSAIVLMAFGCMWLEKILKTQPKPTPADKPDL